MNVTKTAIFKLHNPSNRKRKILDYCLDAYTNASRELLESAKDKLDGLMIHATYLDKRGKPHYSDRLLASALSKLNVPSGSQLASELRDALRQDVAGNLLSYVALKNKGATYPTGRLQDIELNAQYLSSLCGLDDGSISLETSDDYDTWRNNLNRLSQYRPMPVLFSRNRQFKLEQLENGTWGVDLILLARDNRFGQQRFAFPIECGEWHKEFLEHGHSQVATLCKRDGEYYLHIAFAFEVEAIEIVTLMGIDRGILKQAAYAILSPDGTMVLHQASNGQSVRGFQLQFGKERQALQQSGKSVTRKHFKKQYLGQCIHQIANEIVATAKLYRSQVVLEDLNIHVAGKFTRSLFAKLETILNYKLPLAGLPRPRKVFAAKSSMIHHVCGEIGERGEGNERELFYCPTCDVTCDADENAAVNIARRILYRKSDWEKQGGYLAFHRSFANTPIPVAISDFRGIDVVAEYAH